MNYEEEMNWMDSTVEQKALDWLQEKNLSRPPNSPLPRAFDAASNTVRRMLISLSWWFYSTRTIEICTHAISYK